MPTVTILRNTPATQFTNVVNTTGVVFRVTFNEAVTGVAIGDFNVSGPASSAISNLNPVSTTVYDVTVDSYAADGTIDLGFIGAHGIVDNAGNAFNEGTSITSEETYIIDQTQPTVALTDDHADAVVKDADDVLITATFTEANTISSSPTITIGTAVVGATMTSTADNKVWTYLWDLGTDSDVDGAYAVSISATDNTGNTNTAATAGTGGQTSYTIDNSAPTVAITLNAPAQGSVTATTSSSVVFALTFVGDIDASTVDVSDFTVNTTGTVGFTGTAVGGSSPNLTFTVSGISGDGDLGITLGTSGIQDIAGNNLSAAGTTSGDFGIDNTLPTVTILRNTPATQFTNVVNTTGVVFRVTFNEAVTGVAEDNFV